MKKLNFVVCMFAVFFCVVVFSAQAKQEKTVEASKSVDVGIETFRSIVLQTLNAQERIWGVKEKIAPRLTNAQYINMILQMATAIAKETKLQTVVVDTTKDVKSRVHEGKQ